MVFTVLIYVIRLNVSDNKDLQLYSYLSCCLILNAKCCKEKEPEDEHMHITVHIINNNICDANPLDN